MATQADAGRLTEVMMRYLEVNREIIGGDGVSSVNSNVGKKWSKKGKEHRR
jgi:hypothetical protein